MSHLRRAALVVAVIAVTVVAVPPGPESPAAAAAVGPGGVAAPTLWLRADAGVTQTSGAVTAWADQSATGATATAFNTPAYTANGWNFNPTVAFDRASSEYLGLPSGYADFTGGLSTFVARIGTGTAQAWERLYDFGNGTANDNILQCHPADVAQMCFHIWDGSTSSSVDTTDGGFTNGTRAISSVVQAGGAPGSVVTPTIRTNGRTNATSGVGKVPGNVTRTSNYVARSNWGADPYFNGQIPELIMFNRTVTAAERARIESYLAAKYGLTLDQTTAQNYLASDGTTTMWNATTAGAYKNNITVIGRDDASDLSQKQSLAQTANGMVTMALGSTIGISNAALTSTFGADRTFQAISDDNGAIGSWTTTESPSANRPRIAREWQVQETGTVGNVTISIPASTSTATNKLPATTKPMYLLVDADGDFSSGATEVPMTLVSTEYRVTTDLAAGSYVTFATASTGPGGVTAPTLWLRADAGVTQTSGAVTAWADQSPTGATATAFNTPTYTANGWNFNPTVAFDRASSEYLSLPSGYANFTGGMTTITTRMPTGTAAGWERLFDFNVGTGSLTDTVQEARFGTTNDWTHVNYVGGANTKTTITNGLTTGVRSIGNYSQPGGAEGATVTPTVRLTGAATTATSNVVPRNLTRTSNFVGRSNSAADPYFNGEIPELALYGRQLTATESLRLESYLAAKYGLTLDQATAQNYLASDGTTTMWNAATGGANKFNITVIGRDDNSELNQKQSLSQSGSGLVTLALGTTVAASNAANGSTFGADKTFQSIGDDNGAIVAWTATEAPSPYRTRIAREWRVQETGNVGNVTISVPGSTSTAATKLPATTGRIVMLVDADGDFSSGATEVPMAPNGTDWQTTVDLTAGSYVTFASASTSPGGVGSPALWLRADQGVTQSSGVVSSWLDQSAAAATATANSTPGYSGAGWNFNPDITLSQAANSYFALPAGYSDFTAGVEWFGAYRPTASPALAWERLLDLSESNGGTGHFNSVSVARSNATTDLAYAVYINSTGGASTIGGSGMTANASTIASIAIPGGTAGATVTPAGRVNGKTSAVGSNTRVPNVVSRTLNSVGHARSSAYNDLTFTGSLPETILFNRTLTASERLRIESYLAAKYGTSIDQTTAQNYLASDGTTAMWNATTGGAYKNNITVVGRDDLSALNQKQSLSQTGNGVVTVALGSSVAASNAANSSTFAADKAFQALADDGAAVSSWGTTERPSTNATRIAREWQVQETGTVGNVTLSIPASTSTAATKLPSTSGAVMLLVDVDGDFSSGATQVPLTLVGTDYRATLDLTAGQYLTVASYAAPATPTTAPDLRTADDSGASSTDNITKAAAPSFDVACATGHTATLVVDGTAGTPVTCTGATATLAAATLSDGTHTVAYRMTETASGLTSADSPTLAVTIDTVAPATPALPDLVDASDTGSFNNDNITSDSTPRLSATCTTGNTVTGFIDGVSAGSVTCTAGTASRQFTPAWSDGPHTARWTETDVAGNVSPQSPALTVVIDTTAPATPTTAPDLDAASDTGPSSTDNITNDSTPTFTLTGCTTGDIVTLRVGGTASGTATCTAASASITTPVLADGARSVTWTATDTAGNTSAASPALSVTIDTTAPTATTAPDLDAASDTGISSTDNITNDTTPTFTIACTTGDTVTLRVSGTVSGTATCTAGTVSITTPVLTDAARSVTWTATDTAGNVSATSPALPVSIDTTAPATPTNAPDLDAATDLGDSFTDNLTSTGTPAFVMAVCSNGDTVTLRIDGFATGTATCATGMATYTVVAALSDGTHSARWTATDAAGNTSATSPALTFVIDSTAPPTPTVAPDLDAASDTGTSSTDDITNDDTPTFTVTGCVSGLQVTLRGLGTPWATATCVGGSATLDVTSAVANGHWPVTWTQRSAAGASSAASPALSVTIDAAAPPTPATAPDLAAASDSGASDSDNITNDGSPTFTVTGCVSGLEVTLLTLTTPWATATCVDGTATLEVSDAIDDGDWPVSWIQTSVAGVSSASSPTLTFVLDRDPAWSNPYLSPGSQNFSGFWGGETTFDDTPNIDASCQSGSQVSWEVLDTNDAVVATMAAVACPSGSAFTTVTTPLPDGVYRVRTRATDVAGNYSDATSNRFYVAHALPTPPVLDLPADSDSGRSQSDDLTNVTSPRFDVTCRWSDTISIRIDGIPSYTENCWTNYIYGVFFGTPFRATDLSDGPHTLTITANDSANHVSAAGSLTIVVDTVAPDAPTTGPDLDAASDSGASYTDDVTSDTTPTFTLSGCVGDDTVTLLADDTPIGTATCAGGTATITADPPLADGSHHIVWTDTDPAGNTSAASSAVDVTVDTVVPDAPTTAPDLDAASDTGASSTDDLTNDTTPTFTVGCTTDDTVTLYEGTTAIGSGRCIGGAAAVTVGTPFTDGLHAVAWTATDPAGNVSDPSPALPVGVDATAPTTPAGAPDLDAASDTGASSTDDVTSDTTPTFTLGGCTTDDTVTLLIDGHATGTVACASGTVSYTVVAALGDGVHSATWTATDPAGNTSGASPALAFTVDAAPAAPATAPDLAAASDTGSSSSDDLTNDTTPTFTLACSSGDTATLYVGGLAAGTATCTAGTATVTTPALADGTVIVTWTRTRPSGSESAPSVALSVTIDATAPATPALPDLDTASDTGASSTDDLTNDATPTITVTGCTNGDTLTLRIDGFTTGTASCASGTAAYTVAAALTDGTHAIRWTATDPAGNTSAASATLTITVDTTAPIAATAADLDTASDTGTSPIDHLTNDTTPSFTVNGCVDGDTVTLVIDGTAAVSATCATGTASLTAPTLAGGAHTVRWTATDPAGNTSALSPTLTVTIDATAPATPTAAPDLAAASDTGPSTTDDVTADATPTFTLGACTNGDIVTLLVNGVPAGTATCASGSATVTTPALADGTVTVTWTASDAAGNTSAPSAALGVTIDTTAPAAPATPDLDAASDTGSSTTDDLTTDLTPTFTVGGCADGDTVTLVVDGTATVTAPCVSGAASLSAPTLTDGAHTVAGTATDPAGNVGATSSALTVTVDATAPPAPSGAPALDAASDTGTSHTDGVTADATPTFTVVCDDGDTVRLYVQGIVAATATCTGGTASITVPTLADGTVAVTWTTTDGSGNESAPSPATTLTVDTTAPAAPPAPDLDAASDTGASSTDDLTADATPTIDASGCAHGDDLTLAIDGFTIATVPCTPTATAAYTVAAALGDGVHTLRWTATDLAGNTSAASATLSITVDTTAPTATAAADLDAASDSGTSTTDDLTNDTIPTFTVTGCVDGDTVTLVIDGAATAAVATCAASAATLTAPTALVDGAHTITWTATDPAGNTSAPAPALSVTVDATAPAATTAADLDATSDTGASSTDDLTADATPTIVVGCASGDEVTLAVDGIAAIPALCSGTSVAVTLPTLGDGAHTITWTATDPAGNTSAVAPALVVTVDTAAPAAPALPDLDAASDTGASSTDDLTADATPTVTVTGCVDGDTLTVSLDGFAVGTATCASGTASYTVAAALGDGAHTLRWTATDSAGNTSPSGPALTITIDATAPAAVAPVTAENPTAAGSGRRSTADATPTMTFGPCAAGDTVVVYDGTPIPAHAVATIPCAAGQARSAVAALTDGDHAITWAIADAAGNTTVTDPGYTLAVAADSDGDGTLDSAEGTADGNGDGVADLLQPEVSTIANPWTGGSTTLVADDGCTFTRARALDPASTAVDVDHVHANGVFDYAVECLTPGASTDITFHFPGTADLAGAVARKFQNGSYRDYPATFGSAPANGSVPAHATMTVTVVDGGDGDDDGAANGSITDPIGPSRRSTANNGTTTTIPTTTTSTTAAASPTTTGGDATGGASGGTGAGTSPAPGRPAPGRPAPGRPADGGGWLAFSGGSPLPLGAAGVTVVFLGAMLVETRRRRLEWAKAQSAASSPPK